MIELTDEQFADLIDQSIAELPAEHMRAAENIAIVYADEPTPEQREQLRLRHDETLFGLYEGVPLARRQGVTSYGPDKITIFKGPITLHAQDFSSLKAQIKRTVWHELAHYFGLDHPAIRKLEEK
ncbi:MAG TPA: metallopeptidase family protein [Nevskiaceae bacterium]|nr:metallopeptidase family protein [Nevskiaceae bacterium]